MFKVLLMYGHPVDKESFDQYFENTHLKLLTAIPRVEAINVSRVLASLAGEASLHISVELVFVTNAALQDGLSSEAGQAVEFALDFRWY